MEMTIKELYIEILKYKTQFIVRKGILASFFPPASIVPGVELFPEHLANFIKKYINE